MSKRTKNAIHTESFIEVRGLDNLLNWLHHADSNLEKALRAGLKDAAKPVLHRARANAHYIADDGTYRDSLSIRAAKGGRAYLLRSDDVAAPVKEFAKPGAVRLVGQSSKSSTQRARARAGQPLAFGLRAVRVGVPRRANAPRVMIPAVDDSADEVRDRIQEQIEKVLKEARGE